MESRTHFRIQDALLQAKSIPNGCWRTSPGIIFPSIYFSRTAITHPDGVPRKDNGGMYAGIYKLFVRRWFPQGVLWPGSSQAAAAPAIILFYLKFVT